MAEYARGLTEYRLYDGLIKGDFKGITCQTHCHICLKCGVACRDACKQSGQFSFDLLCCLAGYRSSFYAQGAVLGITGTFLPTVYQGCVNGAIAEQAMRWC